MNMITLLTTLRDAIHDSSATQTWCTSNYTRNHKVLVGTDHQEPPAQGQFPLVLIRMRQKHLGYELETQDHWMEIVPAIYDASSRTGGKTNVVEMNGEQNIETFRKLVESVIVTAVATLTGMRIDEMQIRYSTLGSYPHFDAQMLIKIVSDYYGGGDVFA